MPFALKFHPLQGGHLALEFRQQNFIELPCVQLGVRQWLSSPLQLHLQPRLERQMVLVGGQGCHYKIVCLVGHRHNVLADTQPLLVLLDPLRTDLLVRRHYIEQPRLALDQHRHYFLVVQYLYEGDVHFSQLLRVPSAVDHDLKIVPAESLIDLLQSLASALLLEQLASLDVGSPDVLLHLVEHLDDRFQVVHHLLVVDILRTLVELFLEQPDHLLLLGTLVQIGLGYLVHLPLEVVLVSVFLQQPFLNILVHQAVVIDYQLAIVLNLPKLLGVYLVPGVQRGGHVLLELDVDIPDQIVGSETQGLNHLSGRGHVLAQVLPGQLDNFPTRAFLRQQELAIELEEVVPLVLVLVHVEPHYGSLLQDAQNHFEFRGHLIHYGQGFINKPQANLSRNQMHIVGWKGINCWSDLNKLRSQMQQISLQVEGVEFNCHGNNIQMTTQSLAEQQFSGKYLDSERDKKSKKRKPHMTRIIMNVSDTQYPVVKFAGKKLLKWNLDYSPIEDFNFDICWTDNVVRPQVLARMQPHQKINHFPGMSVLSRKNNLGRNLMKMRKSQPEEYDFFPMTFMIPGDYTDLKAYHTNRKPGKAQTFIVKPEAGCQGRGIYLTRNIDKIKPTDKCVVQRYMHRPFLLDQLKFDLRIYVLITGVDPLRLYVFDQGLVRLATEPYVAPRSDNLDDICMHLTNYAINKDSPNFMFNQSTGDMGVGHKRSLTYLFDLLTEKGFDVPELKRKIDDIFIKTFISGHPVLSTTYRSCQQNNFSNDMCFQLLGFDIMLDSKLNPVLLEVNYTPSFSTDTPLDSLIKKNAVRDTLRMLNVNEKGLNQLKAKRDKDIQQRLTTGKRKKYSQEQRNSLMNQAVLDRNQIQDNRLGGFRKIYPLNQEQVNKYQPFLKLAYDLSDVVPERAKRTTIGKDTKMYFHPHMDTVLRKNASMKVSKNARKDERLNISADRKVIFDRVDGQERLKKLQRPNSGKSTRKNVSQLPLERESSPIFSNTNLKEAMTRSRLPKQFKQ